MSMSTTRSTVCRSMCSLFGFRFWAAANAFVIGVTDVRADAGNRLKMFFTVCSNKSMTVR